MEQELSSTPVFFIPVCNENASPFACVKDMQYKVVNEVFRRCSAFYDTPATQKTVNASRSTFMRTFRMVLPRRLIYGSVFLMFEDDLGQISNNSRNSV